MNIRMIKIPLPITVRRKSLLIKSRDGTYCNLKLFLVFCVICGHVIEPWINEFAVLEWAYRFFYAFHMPLFIYLSGLFSPRTVKKALGSAGKIFLIYLLCQSISVLFSRLTGQNMSYIRPDWIFWYLLSLSCWHLISTIVYIAESFMIRLHCNPGVRFFWGMIVMLLLITAALAAGMVKGIGRDYSLSRTIVFAPFFLLGRLTPRDYSLKKFRIPALFCFAAGLFLIWFMKCHLRIPVSFFYQAAWYGSLKSRGINYRALSCLAAFLLGFPLLSFAPRRRFFFTRWGSNTLLIYLLHGVIVKAFWTFFTYDLFKLTRVLPWLALPLAFWVLALLGLFSRWLLPLYKVNAK